MRPVSTLERRFWSKVQKSPDPDGCWLWTGSLKNGYGELGRGRRGEGNVYAHRLSYELHKGSIPPGLEVCHECDVRACVNPSHLFTGTHHENLLDMVRKGRHNPTGRQHGEARYNAKLNAAAVLEIRNSSETLSVVAERFGITVSTASLVRRRKSWRHV